MTSLQAQISKYVLLFLLLMAALGASVPVFARQFTVTAGYSEIMFDDMTAAPVRWQLCMPDCQTLTARRAVLFDRNDGYLRVVPALPDADLHRGFHSLVLELDDEVVVRFSRGDKRIEYRLQRGSARAWLELPAATALELATGARFIPEQLPGFGRTYSEVDAVTVTRDGEDVYDDAEQVELAGNDRWLGTRNRYWALLMRSPDVTRTVYIKPSPDDRPVITLEAKEVTAPTRLELFAGPVDWPALRGVSEELSEMLFSDLWDVGNFLSMLCFGMMSLLVFIHRFVDSYGLAIILLSLSVKILMSPLTLLADRWQADVNRQHTLLKPELDAIQSEFRGEEAHYRVLDVYKRHGISQFYTFKSAAGFLIQIPVFIAAFDMLSDNFALNEMPFLWIVDLGKPDRFIELPFALPFFGSWLNLLPFMMTGMSVLAAWLQSEETLSAELQRQQSIRLYLLSAAFFMLFYTFPAGMVLYWTSSNLFHLIKVEAARLITRMRRHPAIRR